MCQAIHAEEAGILQAAKLGISIDRAKLYTSTFPCLLCSKKIIGSGIRKIVYLAPYPMKIILDKKKEDVKLFLTVMSKR